MDRTTIISPTVLIRDSIGSCPAVYLYSTMLGAYCCIAVPSSSVFADATNNSVKPPYWESYLSKS